MPRVATILVALITGLASCRAPEAAPPDVAPAPVEAPVPARDDPPAPAPDPAEILGRHTVEVEGHPIALWSRVPSAPRGAIVLVHGRTWSARPDFDLQVPGESRSLMRALAAAGLATYAVDLRGYGETPRDDTGWLTPDRAAADLAEVLGWVQAQHPSLAAPAVLGWSMGSLVSQLCAQRHPDRLSALVLYGYPRDAEVRHPPGPPAGTEPARKATTAEAAAEDFIIPGAISDAGREAFVAAALQADPIKVDWRAGDQWNALDPAEITVPTLVIHGERDPYAPIAAQAKLFTRLAPPDRAWVIVAGGDHAAHLENCGPRFAEAVVSFLRR